MKNLIKLILLTSIFSLPFTLIAKQDYSSQLDNNEISIDDINGVGLHLDIRRAFWWHEFPIKEVHLESPNGTIIAKKKVSAARPNIVDVDKQPGYQIYYMTYVEKGTGKIKPLLNQDGEQIAIEYRNFAATSMPFIRIASHDWKGKEIYATCDDHYYDNDGETRCTVASENT